MSKAEIYGAVAVGNEWGSNWKHPAQKWTLPWNSCNKLHLFLSYCVAVGHNLYAGDSVLIIPTKRQLLPFSSLQFVCSVLIVHFLVLVLWAAYFRFVHFRHRQDLGLNFSPPMYIFQQRKFLFSTKIHFCPSACTSFALNSNFCDRIFLHSYCQGCLWQIWGMCYLWQWKTYFPPEWHWHGWLSQQSLVKWKYR